MNRTATILLALLLLAFAHPGVAAANECDDLLGRVTSMNEDLARDALQRLYADGRDWSRRLASPRLETRWESDLACFAERVAATGPLLDILGDDPVEYNKLLQVRGGRTWGLLDATMRITAVDPTLRDQLRGSQHDLVSRLDRMLAETEAAGLVPRFAPPLFIEELRTQMSLWDQAPHAAGVYAALFIGWSHFDSFNAVPAPGVDDSLGRARDIYDRSREWFEQAALNAAETCDADLAAEVKYQRAWLAWRYANWAGGALSPGPVWDLGPKGRPPIRQRMEALTHTENDLRSAMELMGLPLFEDDLDICDHPLTDHCGSLSCRTWSREQGDTSLLPWPVLEREVLGLLTRVYVERWDLWVSLRTASTWRGQAPVASVAELSALLPRAEGPDEPALEAILLLSERREGLIDVAELNDRLRDWLDNYDPEVVRKVAVCDYLLPDPDVRRHARKALQDDLAAAYSCAIN